MRKVFLQKKNSIEEKSFQFNPLNKKVVSKQLILNIALSD